MGDGRAHRGINWPAQTLELCSAVFAITTMRFTCMPRSIHLSSAQETEDPCLSSGSCARATRVIRVFAVGSSEAEGGWI